MRSFKKVTSLTLGISFLVMSYTGIMLFLAPKGKVANWVDWHLFGLTKEQYGELHTTSMVVFLLFGVLHIYYNWGAIVNYLKNKNRQISFSGKDFLIALSINVFFVAGTLFMVQPFKAFLDFENSIKEYWADKYSQPPSGHAEELSLKELAKKAGIDMSKAKSKLDQKSIIYKETQEIQEIAKANNITPDYIYSIIKPGGTTKETSTKIEKLGRKTLEELSGMKKIDLQKSIEYIQKNGFTSVTKENRMKDIANELDKMPSEVFEELKKL